MIGKNKPSVAQSLEVIFELVTENTERINGLASILIDSMHLLHQTTRKVDESLIPKEYANQMKDQPRSLPQMLVALEYSLSKPMQIIIAGDPDRADTKDMMREVHQRFVPNKILMIAEGGKNQAAFVRWLPFLEAVKPIKSKATAYVCINYACELPTNDLRVLQKTLDEKR